MYHGRRDEALERNSNFPFDPASIDAIVLSHAHIDHSGNLPGLVKQGFSGPIYCTSATESLCQVMLKDSAYIQEKDAEFINKRHKKKPSPPRRLRSTPRRTLTRPSTLFQGQFIQQGVRGCGRCPVPL